MNNLRVAVAVALAVYGVIGGPSSKLAPFRTVPVAVSSPEWASVVEPVATAVTELTEVERATLQCAYINAAKVVRADGVRTSPVIQTTSGLQAVHSAVVSFVWNGLGENSPGKYTGLRDAIEPAFEKVIGFDDVPMTEDIREDAAGLFESIAAACHREG